MLTGSIIEPNEKERVLGKRGADQKERFLSPLWKVSFIYSHRPKIQSKAAFRSFPTQVPPFTMARSFSNLNALSVHLINAISRRGYGSSSQGFAATAARAGAASVSGKVAKKSGEERVTAEKESWVPDPVTGYYRPENVKEIDVAELRATLLGKK